MFVCRLYLYIFKIALSFYHYGYCVAVLHAVCYVSNVTTDPEVSECLPASTVYTSGFQCHGIPHFHYEKFDWIYWHIMNIYSAFSLVLFFAPALPIIPFYLDTSASVIPNISGGHGGSKQYHLQVSLQVCSGLNLTPLVISRSHPSHLSLIVTHTDLQCSSVWRTLLSSPISLRCNQWIIM